MLQVVREHELRNQLIGAPEVNALAQLRVSPQTTPVAGVIYCRRQSSPWAICRFPEVLRQSLPGNLGCGPGGG
eukprot:8673480-Alexandrium_andersonii.AAC.1